jgi:hypothetical protein
LIWGDPFDDRFLACFWLLCLAVQVPTVFSGSLSKGIACPVARQTLIVVLETLQSIMWGLKVLVRDQHNVDLHPRLKLCDFCALFVQ